MVAQEKQPKVVLGLEMGRILKSLTYYSGRFSISPKNGLLPHNFHITADVPIGKISVGSGLSYYRFGTYENHGYLNNGEENSSYEFRSLNLAAWSVPLRIQYRLPCNCIYAQLTIAPLWMSQPNRQIRYTTNIQEMEDDPSIDPIQEVESIEPFNWLLEVGIGFKLHLVDKTRIYLKPSYSRILKNMLISPNYDNRESFISLYTGLQIALE